MFDYRVLVGVLAVLAAGTSYPSGARAQRQPASEFRTASTAVHSVRITLAPSAPQEKNCRLRPVSPPLAGVYPGDTLVLNVENGCLVDATVRVGDFTRIEPKEGSATLFDAKEVFPKSVKVPAGLRAELRLQIPKTLPTDPEQIFEYPVVIVDPPGAPEVPGRVCMCRQPPCPSS